MTRREPLPALAVVAGVRTPFAKIFSSLAEVPADELGRLATVDVLRRAKLAPSDVGETVFGNVASPPESSNVSRVIALRAGVPQDRPAHTVNRNCAAGMEALVTAWQIVNEGRADLIVAGGTESMSNVPLLWHRDMQKWWLEFYKATTFGRMKLLTKLRPKYLKPVAGLELGLTDPVCGLNMGQTAEILAKEFNISREAQDQFALQSHLKASAAWDRCFYKDEVTPVPLKKGDPVAKDVGPRAKQTLEALAKLKPIFDKERGTVTAGNSCPLTDGAVALVVTPAAHAKAQGWQPLGYIRGYAVAGCDPSRMGLGPVYAMHKLLKSSGLALRDFEQFEINEAFAAQVLACQQAAASDKFCQTEFGTSALGDIDPARLNVNGGAIALGHPIGASGARIVLTLLRSLKETGRNRGLATLCVGGGQGEAVWVERHLDV